MASFVQGPNVQKSSSTKFFPKKVMNRSDQCAMHAIYQQNHGVVPLDLEFIPHAARTPRSTCTLLPIN